jgi:hypothetical protein
VEGARPHGRGKQAFAFFCKHKVQVC